MRRAVGAAVVTTHTPVMGPNLLSAAQLARWFDSVPGVKAPERPVAARQRHRARADLHRRGPDRRSARRHRVRAVDPRDRLVQLPEFADPARRQQLRRHQRVRRPPRSPELQARRPLAEPLLRDRAARRAHADPTAAQLRRRDREAPAAPVDLRAVRSRRRRADLGVLRRQQLPVRQAHLGEREELRDRRPEAVLASARVQRRARRVRAVRAGQQRAELRHRLLDGDRPVARVHVRRRALLRRPRVRIISTSR